MYGVKTMALVALMTLVLTGANLLAQEAAKPAADVSGTWTWSVPGWQGQTSEMVLVLKQEGSKVTGTLAGMGPDAATIEEGKVENGVVTFKVNREMRGRKSVVIYTGSVVGDTFKGTSQTIMNGEFEAARQAPKP